NMIVWNAPGWPFTNECGEVFWPWRANLLNDFALSANTLVSKRQHDKSKPLWTPFYELFVSHRTTVRSGTGAALARAEDQSSAASLWTRRCRQTNLSVRTGAGLKWPPPFGCACGRLGLSSALAR